jgi:hypothetical protein
MNHARRQQYRRLSQAGRLGLASVAATTLGLLAVRTGALGLALLLIVAIVLGLRAHRWLSLAGRSAVGARSEEEVRRAMAPLQEHAWRLRHGLRWGGSGDIDSVAIAPTGVGFTIETKTRRYDERQLGRVLEHARWLDRRRRRWCRCGAFPVLCVVRAAGAERYERGVLVVSIDRLAAVLRGVADIAVGRGGPYLLMVPVGARVG